MKNIFLAIFSLLGVLLLATPVVHATSGFEAGRIIDDSVFTDKTRMSVADIQAFLNSKVTSCDTNGQQLSEFGGPDLNGDGKVQRWEWGQKNYNQTTFPCLKDYTQDGVSAAQLIYNASQTYSINPQVMIVLLQKEQGLVTDTWPLNIQYRSATGYGCPDTAACDSQYYGLKNQLNWAAKMFRAILNNSPTWYTPYILGNNYIHYSPNDDCGGSSVNIINRSTQALYNYTPYQPNNDALNTPMGASVDCGAYGNLNFYRYFTSWFGPTGGPAYAWQELSQKIYTSDSKNTELDRDQVKQGQYMYVEYIVKNTGYKTWPINKVLLGRNSPSPLCTNEWVACERATIINKTKDVPPGDTITFGFWMRAPLTSGFYKVYWNLLIENVSWFEDIGSNHNMTVVSNSTLDHLSPAVDFMKLGDTLTSPDGLSTLFMTTDGTLSVYYKGTKVSTLVNNIHTLRQQSDGNLVAYSQKGTPLWSVGDGIPRQLHITNEGKLVYTKDNTDPGMVILSWQINTENRGEQVKSDQILLQNQTIYSDNKQYFLILQSDGNLVQYGPKGPVWATGRNRGHFLIQQGDGKIVLYDYKGSPIWASPVWVPNGQTSRTVVQGDGNLVTYNGYSPIWAAH